MIAGAILVVMFNADTIAGPFTRLFGGIGAFAPVLRRPLPTPLRPVSAREPPCCSLPWVITTVTVMSVVIQATVSIATPSEEATAGFDVQLSSGLLSFFAPVTDIAAEAVARPDFPTDAVAVMELVSRLSVEACQRRPPAPPAGMVWG